MTSHANLFEKKLTIHICKNEVDAYSCSKNCERVNEIKYSFLVDKPNGKILRKTYSEGKLTSSETDEKCLIFDSQNWQCVYDAFFESVVLSIGSFSSKTERKMNNGIFTDVYKVNYFDDKKPSNTYICAK
jgi:hypothetical protein